MSKYEEIMEHVNIDEKMQDRILSHIDEHFEEKASRNSRRRFYTICATAAAAVLIVCVVNMQGGSSTSTIVGNDAMMVAQGHATYNSLDEVIEEAVAQESEMLAATSPALYKAAENDLAGAAAPDSENTGSSTLSESATDAPAVSSSITSTTQPAETMPALTLYEPTESNYVLAGGYTRAASPVITDEIRAMCAKAFAGMTGATYEPVALLATQVVAGTNYCILCEGTAPDSVKTYVFVYIYEDLEGNATCTEIKDTGVEVYY